jgi:hypothetical protein
MKDNYFNSPHATRSPVMERLNVDISRDIDYRKFDRQADKSE